MYYCRINCIAGSIFEGKVNAYAAGALTVKTKINGRESSWGECSAFILRGMDVLFTVEAETTNVAENGDKKLSYEWRKEGDEGYTCLVSD